MRIASQYKQALAKNIRQQFAFPEMNNPRKILTESSRRNDIKCRKKNGPANFANPFAAYEFLGDFPQCFNRVVPMSEGVLATAIPAASNAAILSAAPPEFPETIAPACPMRLPLGAVKPAINAATGFLQFSFSH